MNWNKFTTYSDSPQNAFETLCNQLFERHLRRIYTDSLTKFRVINGAGGDGGIEAYGQLSSDDIIAVQAKWFREILKSGEIGQIRNSVITAKDLRPQIKEYIICIPHNVSSIKYGRGKRGEPKKPVENTEEKTIEKFSNEIQTKYPDLKITWWFESTIEFELQESNNEGVQKFWFGNEIISLKHLQNQFILQKKGWLNERYIPELHGLGVIHKEYKKVCFAPEYREELKLQLIKVAFDIYTCMSLITKFISTNKSHSELNSELITIKTNLKHFFREIQITKNAIKIGNDYYKPYKIIEVDLWSTKLKLEKLSPNNIQKNILLDLVSALTNIHETFLPQYIERIGLHFSQSIKLIMGNPGTGKTHGLANCVENHLNENSPAIIIQAKGCPCKDWTEILSKSLELTGWNKEEIFSALETLAARNDIWKASTLKSDEESYYEMTKVIICIDGLEEEIDNTDEWYFRMRECAHFAVNYPRIRFIFSSRRYFYDNSKIPKEDIFEDVTLPREGDVPIMDIADKYFSKEHFNIQIQSYSCIKGLDSLLALRLFCDKYKNTIIKDSDKILTATRNLLNDKIERVNEEYLKLLQNRKGNTRNPILAALEIIANHFYTNVEVEHDQLVTLITRSVNYLDVNEIDILIDYLTRNAFLIRSERIEKTDFLQKKIYSYNITYQSIIEHIISEKTYQEIKNGSLNQIPNIILQGMVQPLDFSVEKEYNPIEKAPNQKIIQNIVDNLFVETGKLIGENDFLITGFEPSEILEMQMEALIKAPNELALKYKEKVDGMFFGGYMKQYQVLKYLIFPSSYSNKYLYGAEYLHKILINQPSAFERDKLWSGLDSYERGINHDQLSIEFIMANNTSVFYESGVESLYLSDSYLYNERPLVYAWGLSSIDQQLRNKLRVVLTSWAIKAPTEFLKLLNKIFDCNDPQIQEDLASIMLGVASRLKKKNKIKELANWSVEHVFSNLEKYRNVILRQGFRSIVERAFQLNLISKADVEKCRPKKMKTFSLIPIDLDFLKLPKEDIYPIVHDLEWYVITQSYEPFFESPYLVEKGAKNHNCIAANNLLENYMTAFGVEELSANIWAMSTAIAYIRELGLTRKEGNSTTDATHGGKSKIFTYEEKYTWLAVHYILGYLSDYIPVKLNSYKPEFIKDYTQIIDIPNPAESIFDIDIEVKKFRFKTEWIVKEELSNELILDTETDFKDIISNWVNEEPKLNFQNWLNYYSSDFPFLEQGKWIALYNRTKLHDPKQLCYSIIEAFACLVKKEDLESLKKIVKEYPDRLNFITRIDNLHSVPKTDTYCNPSDIVWMTWIEEEDTSQNIYDSDSKKDKEIFHCITQIIQNNMGKESYFMLPSKKIRVLIGCQELVKNDFKNANGQIIALNHKIHKDKFGDSQELVLVKNDVLEDALAQKGYEIVWFVDLFKTNNIHKKNFGKIPNVQKTRKYFVWNENNEKFSIKFWDEWFNNKRNKK